MYSYVLCVFNSSFSSFSCAFSSIFNKMLESCMNPRTLFRIFQFPIGFSAGSAYNKYQNQKGRSFPCFR